MRRATRRLSGGWLLDRLDVTPRRLDGRGQHRSADAKLLAQPHACPSVAAQGIGGCGKREVPQRMPSDTVDYDWPPDGMEERSLLVAQGLQRAP
jgi:hypothetical protein